MVVNGWALLFHQALIDQLRGLVQAYERARKSDPQGFKANTNVKLLAALARLMLEIIPADPGRPEYRQGNTLGGAYRHWFRAKFFGRFRLFFRYDSTAHIIVYAWVNDQETLRRRGSKNDPYERFRQMLASDHPPDEWSDLVRSASALPAEMMSAVTGPAQRRQRNPGSSRSANLSSKGNVDPDTGKKGSRDSFRPKR